MNGDRIQRNRNGSLDELVIYCGNLHLEQLDFGLWSFIVEKNAAIIRLDIFVGESGRLEVVERENELLPEPK